MNNIKIINNIQKNLTILNKKLTEIQNEINENEKNYMKFFIK